MAVYIYSISILAGIGTYSSVRYSVGRNPIVTLRHTPISRKVHLLSGNQIIGIGIGIGWTFTLILIYVCTYV